MRAYVCACVRVRRKVEGEGEAERISASVLVSLHGPSTSEQEDWSRLGQGVCTMGSLAVSDNDLLLDLNDHSFRTQVIVDPLDLEGAHILPLVLVHRSVLEEAIDCAQSRWPPASTTSVVDIGWFPLDRVLGILPLIKYNASSTRVLVFIDWFCDCEGDVKGNLVGPYAAEDCCPTNG